MRHLSRFIYDIIVSQIYHNIGYNRGMDNTYKRGQSMPQSHLLKQWGGSKVLIFTPLLQEWLGTSEAIDIELVVSRGQRILRLTRRQDGQEE